MHIRSCPFCGNAQINHLEIDVGQWALTCVHCKATGPTAESHAQAIRDWNRRAAAADPCVETPLTGLS